jgi:hypothetical protein
LELAAGLACFVFEAAPAVPAAMATIAIIPIAIARITDGVVRAARGRVLLDM